MREINGQAYQHATTTITAKATGGEMRFKNIHRIRRRHSVGSDPTYNAQGQRDGFVFGQEEAELEWEMKYSEYEAFRDFLATNAPGGGIVQSIFDMPVTYGNAVNALKTVVAVGCHLTEEAVESSREGGDIMVTVPVFVTTFDYPGRAPLIVYDT